MRPLLYYRLENRCENHDHPFQETTFSLSHGQKNGAHGAPNRGENKQGLILELNLVGNTIGWQLVLKLDQFTILYVTEENRTTDGRIAGIFKVG